MKNYKNIVLIILILVSCQSKAQELFMAVTKSGNNGYILKTSDYGKTMTTIWDSEMEAETGQNRLFDITSGDGKLVAVGNTILTSEDKGKSWKESNVYTYTGDIAFPNREAMKCVAYGNGFFVAAGKFHIIYSKDGIDWKFVRTGEKSTAEKRASKSKSGLSLKDIKKNPKLHGKRPSKGEFPPEIHPGLQYPLDMLYAKGKFYLVGGNRMMQGQILKIEGDKIVVEKDMALTGNAASINTGGLKSIAWDGKNTLVASSNSTKTAYSTDMGETWKYMFNPAKNQIWGLAYHNSMWVAASPFEDIFIAGDITQKWTENFKRGGGRSAVFDMIHDGNRFVLVGNDATMFTSKDGKDWSAQAKKKFGYHVKGITALNNTVASNTTGSVDWKTYRFNNDALNTSYDVLVHANGTNEEKQTKKNEVQLVSKKGSEKIIVSVRKLDNPSKTSNEKLLTAVINTYKKNSKTDFEETTKEYNGIDGIKVSYTSKKNVEMNTFNAISDDDKLIIIACVNMNSSDAQTVFNSFNLKK
ncbi:hypothetical protein ATO12_12660 [Aquimarina atlantica]|uniref:Photosynthesis system II assembly factor Ycf48/Hcf136-like domain-containing protein n=1 Tax=Aquimarina atlantica TaxID=1317122 RepID=A0A023BX39_9FLAO|nr:hypothetical protein [Aquimarina atlantica]EZH74611.1 hypothetical protein ATO12_12660 [Aquimarina atlantica]